MKKLVTLYLFIVLILPLMVFSQSNYNDWELKYTLQGPSQTNDISTAQNFTGIGTVITGRFTNVQVWAGSNVTFPISNFIIIDENMQINNCGGGVTTETLTSFTKLPNDNIVVIGGSGKLYEYDVNSEQWNQYGLLSDTFSSIVEYIGPNQLFIAGKFKQYGGTLADYACVYNTLTDSIIPINLPGPAQTISRSGNRIYIIYQGLVTEMKNFAVFDVNTLSIDSSYPAPPPNYPINAIAVHGDTVYIVANSLADVKFHLWRSDGTAWSDLGTFRGGGVSCMTFHNQKLYIGGGMIWVNNMEADHWAEFDESTNELTPGFVPAAFRAITVTDQGELIGVTAGGNILSTNKTTGINDMPNNIIIAYPNPASDKLIINTLRQGTVHLYNILGQEVASLKLEGSIAEIDISSMLKGMYFLKSEDIPELNQRILIQ